MEIRNRKPIPVWSLGFRTVRSLPPKTILTKNERANLVYAVKIAVKNDGSLKIGMYGGVVWKKGEPIVVVKEISKSYGKVEALKEVSFAVEQGEVFGLIGPDGKRGRVPYSAS